MGQPSFWDNFRGWIGRIAFHTFLWSTGMTEDEYWEEMDTALEDAIDLAAEGMSYTSPYFIEKWEMDKRLADLKEILHQRKMLNVNN